MTASYNLSLLGSNYNQGGTGAVARTTASKLQESVSVLDFGADPTGVSNSGSAITAAFTASPIGPVAFPYGTYLSSAISVPQNGTLRGNNSLINASANSISVVFATGGPGIGDVYYQEIRDLNIAANSKTGITGFSVDTVNAVANLTMQNVKIENADTISFNFGGVQFCRFTNLIAASGTGVGFYLAPSAAGGGANSNEFYGLIAVYKQVGLMIDGTPGNFGSISNNFYNFQANGNSLCGTAIFSASATFYGGSPEANCQSGPASATVQGKTVKQCSLYANAANVRCENFVIEEYGSTTFAILENSSILTLGNVSGGSTNGDSYLVKADSTSGVLLTGLFQGIGLVQNVLRWPDQIRMHQSGGIIFQCVLYGTPINTIDSSVTPLLADASPTMYAYGSSPGTLTYVDDPELGNCANIACTAVVNGSVNQFFIPGLLANQNVLITFLIKSSVNCSLYTTFTDGTNTRRIGWDGGVTLVAGQTVRVMMSAAMYNAGSGALSISPYDTSAPVLKIAKMQVYQGPVNNEKTFADMATICKNGLFNPGVIRETATNLAIATAAVNAGNKYPGKQVWDTTNNRVVFAAGRLATSVWKDGVNSTVYTPV